MATLPRNKKLPNRLGGRPKASAVKDTGPKPRNPINGHRKGDGMPKYFGAVGGYKGVNTNYVNRLVKGLIKPAINDLRLQKNQLNHDTLNAVRHTREDYTRGQGDLSYVHGETGDYLNSLGQKNSQLYNNTNSHLDAANAALKAQLGNTYSGAQNAAQDELARLGIQGGGSFAQLGADQANALATGDQANTNAHTTAELAGGNAAAALQMLAGMNQGSYMQGVGQNLNKQQTALADIRAQNLQGKHDIRQAMVDARGSRKDAVLQLLQQLQQTGWSQYLQNQQQQQYSHHSKHKKYKKY